MCQLQGRKVEAQQTSLLHPGQLYIHPVYLVSSSDAKCAIPYLMIFSKKTAVRDAIPVCVADYNTLCYLAIQVTALQADDGESGVRRSPRIVAKRIRSVANQVDCCMSQQLGIL